MKSKNSDKKINITKHGIISSLYFNAIFRNIIKLIDVKKKVKVLDFGCGYGYLKKKLKRNKKIKVINYDIIKELTEIDDWKNANFDYFVCCHVFVYLKKKKIESIIKYIKKNHPKAKIIVAITKQGWLNKIGAFILNEPNAHLNLHLTSSEEIFIFSKYMRVIKKMNILFLTDVYLLEFI